MSQLNELLISNISDLAKKCSLTSELEVSIQSGKITRDKFINILEFLCANVKENKYKLIKSTTLDVNFSTEDNTSQRITISELDNINQILRQFGKRNNYEIYNELINLKKVNNNINFINKKRLDVVTLEDYNVRIRLSDENNIKDNELTYRTSLDNNKILFRFKNRNSFVIKDDKNITLKIDLTCVKSGRTINNVFSNAFTYELEVELTFKTLKIDDNIIKSFVEEIIKLVQIFQQSKIIISKNESNIIINDMKTLLKIDPNFVLKDLPFMRAVSTELVDITDKIPNHYAVTDKADGEHAFLFISKEVIYLIRNNLEVIKLDDILINNKILKEYNNSILDCEFITHQKDKHYILCFDILYHKGNNVMGEKVLSKRLSYMYDVTSTLFFDDIPKKYEGEFDLNKILKFYETDLIRCMNSFNKNINGKHSNIIHSKYFIYIVGGNPCEIYAYTDLLWNLYLNKSKFNCPYHLDGTIYVGMNQEYVASYMRIPVVFKLYKWKPSDKNSIDFYIEFEKDPVTKKILDVYDATITSNKISEFNNDEEDLNYYETDKKPYRIANLHVGKRLDNNRETYVLFQKDVGNYIANLYLVDGYVRDIDGNIIQDKTVVEFGYNNDQLIDPHFRWVPLKTRDDKTEQVNLYQRQYGNSEYVADKVYDSIMNPIIEQDIKLLGDPKTFTDHIKFLKSKITTDIITKSRQEDKYYELKSNLAKPFREFQNFVKSCLIFIYCKELEVLDIGCGRGGDIMKFFHAHVKAYVGFDIAPSGISDGADGAISRYNTMRSRNKGYFPKMTFFVGDAMSLLNYHDQYRSLGSVVDDYKKSIIEFFGEDEMSKSYKRFDVINCQFMVHYCFKTETTFTNFCKNVNKLLKKNGIILITTFDGELIHKNFDNTGHITGTYTTDTGEKDIAYDISKLYATNVSNINQFGLSIDVLMKWISNDYYTEYLVSKEFFIQEFKKYNMELIETDLFGTLFELNRQFLTESTTHESSKTANWFLKPKEFYDDNQSINICTRNYSKLTRYYIFRKTKD